jgi:hypothetical protein
MSTTEEKPPSHNIDTIAKIYPFIGKDRNRKGYYIGNYKIVINSEDLPFTNFDQVDHMIYNLYNYAKTRKNPKEFFIYHPEKMTLIPGKMTETGMSGGRRRKMTETGMSGGRRRKMTETGMSGGRRRKTNRKSRRQNKKHNKTIKK